jgi:hypothetical protein
VFREEAHPTALPQPGSVVFSYLHGRRVRLLAWLPAGSARVADLRNNLPLGLADRPEEMTVK